MARSGRGEGALSNQTRDQQVRRVILIEGAANLAVLVLKAVVGFHTGSIAILGDAVHSLTDVANNVVAWLVTRLSAEPADERHPYGHRKFESVAVFALATLLTVLALELALGALRRETPEIQHTGWGLGVMLGVLVINAGLSTWQGRWARRLDSDILLADSRHTLADVLTTAVVIAGWQAAARGYPWVDTVAALGVTAIILVLAYGLFRRAIPILVDEAVLEPDALLHVVASVPGILSVRSVRSRGDGKHNAVDIVASVAPDLSTVASHEVATAVERAVRAGFRVDHVIVHVEPDRGS